MSITEDVPEFAIVGHPNEGKSSVLSTLSEDDSVRVSPTPGETTVCRSFPVSIDGKEIIRFIDTPGFQNPRQTLAWMRAYGGDDTAMLDEFIISHADDPAFHDDCALLTPLRDGAGLIFVVDGSRPLRNIDRAEMEILRLTGRPRMAIINCKDDESRFLEAWQHEFRKHFNSIRLFNANHATYGQRIALLSSLKAIDQDREDVIERVIQAFQQDWKNRNRLTASHIITLLDEGLSYKKRVSCPVGADEKQLQVKLQQNFAAYVSKRERATHQKIRRLFKHTVFNLELPARSILQEDLFAEKTWQFLGLTSDQLILAGAVSGAALAAGLDVVAGGASLGFFAALGGVFGAATAALKGKELLSGHRLLGIKLDRQELQVGPVNNIQLMYILLDRSLLYYTHIIHWAHGRRDYPETAALKTIPDEEKKGYASSWSRDERRICEKYFKALQQDDPEAHDRGGEAMMRLLGKKLAAISTGTERSARPDSL